MLSFFPSFATSVLIGTRPEREGREKKLVLFLRALVFPASLVVGAIEYVMGGRIVSKRSETGSQVKGEGVRGAFVDSLLFGGLVRRGSKQELVVW